MLIRREIQNLGSRFCDGTLMYHGQWLFTWVRVSAHMPWSLASIELVQS
jgi:hypothetical protein